MLLSWKKACERDFENMNRLNKIIYSLMQCQKEEVLHSDNQNKISYGLKEESEGLRAKCFERRSVSVYSSIEGQRKIEEFWIG